MKNTLYIDGVHYLTAREAGDVLGYAPDYVSRLCREGKLRGRRAGKTWIVEADSLVPFIKAHEARKEAWHQNLSRELKSVAVPIIVRDEDFQPLSPVNVAPRQLHILRASQKAHAAREEAQTMMITRITLSSVFAVLLLFVASATPLSTPIANVLRNTADAHVAAASFFSPIESIARASYESITSIACTITGWCDDVQPMPVVYVRAPHQPIAPAPAPTQITNNITNYIQPTVGSGSVLASGVSEQLLESRLNAMENYLTGRIELAEFRGDRQAESLADSFSDGIGGGGFDDIDITDSSFSGGSISGASISGSTLSGVTFSGAQAFDALEMTDATSTNATSTNMYVSGSFGFGTSTGLLRTTNGIASTLANGNNGQVLKIVGGNLTWSTDLTGGGGGGASFFASTTDDLAIYPADPSQVVIIGDSATTTVGNILEIAGNSLFRGAMTSYGDVTAPRFTATSSVASVFPYASTTALSTNSLCLSGECRQAWPDSAFSTTSADYWQTQRNFFSTTSADYYKSVNNFFSTSSADYWKTANNFFSTTSADAWKEQRNFFSTTSASYFLSQNQGNAFSTTSADHLLSTYNKGFFFSTTSAQHFLTQNGSLGFSTTSNDYWMTQRNFFSTSSADYYKTVNNFFSTTSADYWGSTKGYATFGYLFPSNATSTRLDFNAGLTAYASSTIGGGTRTSGLTISGGATTTGTAYFAGNVGIGTTSPYDKLSVAGNVVAARFVATTSTASVFPYASTTALSAVTLCLTGDSCISAWPTFTDTSFSTTSADYWKTQRDFFSTTSASYFLSQNQGNAFSSTSAAYFLTQNGSLGFSTTSNDYWASQRNFFSTTSADAWKDQRNFFSTSSANYFASIGLAFSTTSNDYWKSVNNFFSTTSADYYTSVNNFFSTTSADAWKDQRNFFSTTSATYFAHSSTTIPKTYTANTFTALQTFGNASSSIFSADTICLSNDCRTAWPSAGSSFDYPFSLSGNATSTLTQFNGGLTAYASSTIGNGTAAGGLTVNGTATTSRLVVSGTGTSTFAGDILMGGSIIPSIDNTYSLGSESRMWKDVYIGPGSLYVNGKKVIEDVSDTITFSTDADQSLMTETSGVGNVTTRATGSGNANLLTGSGNINITSTSGNINIGTSGSGQLNLGIIASGTWQGMAIADNYLVKSGNWTGTLDGYEAAQLLGGSFATTSADYWKTQRDFFSTTSASYFSAAGLAWSTTSANYYLSQNAALGFSTTSNDYWRTQRSFFSTTSADFHVASFDKGFFFSTTSAEAWKLANDFFSTTSSDYWQSQRSFFSTTSASYFLAQNQGAAFSTTSAQYFAHSSTTIPKTYTANTFTMGNLFLASTTIGGGATSTGLTINGGATTTGSAYFAGNVGIGRANPQYPLDVQGLVRIGGGTIHDVSHTGISYSSPGSWYTSEYNSGRGAGNALASEFAFWNSNTEIADFQVYTGSGGVNTGAFAFNTRNGSGLAERMRLDMDGNLGIGTTSPYAKLSVVGDAVAARFVATTSAASIFPYASTTALSATSLCLMGDSCISSWPTFTDTSFSTTSAIYFAHSSTTIPKTYTSNTFTELQQFANASSTLFSASYASTTDLFANTASTSNLTISALQNGLLKVDGSGNVSLAVAGTDFANFAYPFPNSATSTLLSFNGGLTAYASTTIGDGTRTGGLTVNGGATTTGTAYFGSYVGINVMDPVESLEVGGNINIRDGYLTFQDQGYGIFGLSTPSVLFYNDSIRFVENGQDLMRVMDSGNVGIGTTSPGSLLSIGTTNGINFSTATSTFSSTGGINLAGGCYAINGTCITGGGSSLFTDGGATTYLTAVDNLGLGTTTANSKLTIFGDIFAEGSNRYLNFGTATGTNGYGFRDNGGVMEFKNAGGTWQGVTTATTGPTFMAVKSATQDINGTPAVVTWESETFDTNGNFASNRFTPTVPGKYLLTLSIYAQAVDANERISIRITKNGSIIALQHSADMDSTRDHTILATVLVDANGSTDYFEALAATNSGATETILNLSHGTYFTGTMIAPVNGNNAAGWANDGNASFLLDNADKVGVGTSTPWAKLAIQGDSGQLNPVFEVASSSTATKFLSVSSTGFGTTTLSGLNISGSATTTSNVGINLASGCYAINGACIGGGSGSSQWTTTGSDIYYDTGNVGIGVSSPSYALTVTASTTGLMSRFYNSATTNGQGLLIRAGETDVGTRVLQVASRDDTKLMTVLSTGNVGIGTTTPAYRLEVLNTSTTLPGINIGETSTSDRRATIGFGLNPSLTSGWIMGQALGATTVKDFYLHDISTGATRLLIDTSGNFGIGTTQPNSLLHLSSSSPAISLTDNRNFSTPNWIGVQTGGLLWTTADSSAPGSIGEIAIVGSAASGNAPFGDMIFRTGHSAALGQSFGERMRITNTGDIGIGTTSPLAPLHVYNSDARITLQDTATGASAITYHEFRDGNGTRLGFIGDGSSGSADIGIRNDQAGGGIGFSLVGASTAMSISSTGDVTMSDTLSVTGAITEGGSAVLSAANIDTCAEFAALVAAFNSGACGNLVFSASPTFSGTITGVVANFSSNVTTDTAFLTGDSSPINNNAPGSLVHSVGYVMANRSANPSGYFGRTNDGAVVQFYSAGVNEGAISITGSTVTYGAFTGAHYATMDMDETIERGMLVELDGTQTFKHGTSDSEPTYGVRKTSAANSPAVFGSMLSLMEPNKPHDPIENPYLIMAVGNGDMWVVQSDEEAIEPGDYLISSNLAGHAMKDPGTYMVSHIVARAAQKVDWSTIPQVAGMKRAKISVTFEQFDRNAALSDVFAALATSTASSSETTEVQEFATSFLSNLFARMNSWLADAGNGIAEIFTKTLRAENVYADTVTANKLCLEDLCVTKAELQQMLNQNGTSPAPEPFEETPALEPEHEAEEPAEEPADEPAPEIETPVDEEPEEEPAGAPEESETSPTEENPAPESAPTLPADEL